MRFTPDASAAHGCPRQIPGSASQPLTATVVHEPEDLVGSPTKRSPVPSTG